MAHDIHMRSDVDLQRLISIDLRSFHLVERTVAARRLALAAPTSDRAGTLMQA